MLFRLNNTRNFARSNPCAQCGKRLSRPEWSEHVDRRCVRHLWKCEGCDYAFETTVSYATTAAV